MKYSKDHYRKIKRDGFTWSGFWDGLHHFSKRLPNYKYVSVSCTEKMLVNGDFKFMVDNGLTFTGEGAP